MRRKSWTRVATSTALLVGAVGLVQIEPASAARLVQLQRLLGDRVGRDIFFYSISIDPARDTPDVLKAYAQKFGVGPGWLFLTGREDDIRLAARKLGLSPYRSPFRLDPPGSDRG